jgi:hypothetical protein
MYDVILAAYRCPNEPLARESWIHDGVSRIPLLAGFCQPAVVGAQWDNCGWQIDGGMNLMESP